MIRPVAELESYRYSISDVSFGATGFTEPIVVQAIQVVSITILKKYETDIQPIIFISMNVNKTDYEKIVTNLDTMVAEFTIFKSKEMPDESTVVYEEPYISGKFKAYNKDMMDTRVAGQLRATISDATNTTETSAELNLFLYDHNLNINFRKNQSVNIYGTMNDALFLALHDRGFTNILMSPADYKTQHLVSPVGTLAHNLNSLDDVYGIYDAPRIFFSDFDCTYLLDKGKMGTVLRKDELSTVNMYLEKIDDANAITSGCYVDLTNGYYILNAIPFSINDTDTMADFAMAGKATTVIAGSKDSYSDVVGDYPVEATMRAHHEKAHKQMVYNINQGKRSVPIEFTDIDASIITPNKRYVLIPDDSYDQKYAVRGEYRLSQSVIVLSRKAEKVFKCVVQCMFIKTKEV